MSKGGINAVTDYYKKLGDEHFDKLIDMFVFDAVVCNTDRHFGNFGVLVDNYTNKIIDNAPIFDNGLSLWGFAMEMNLMIFPHMSIPVRLQHIRILWSLQNTI